MVTETKTRTIEPDITVLEISGTLHLGNTLIRTETAVKRMVEDGVRRLIVDLSGLNYIDSAGIGMLIGCAGAMDQAGGKMRIAGARGAVAKSFDVVKISKVVPLDGDVEAASKSISE